MKQPIHKGIKKKFECKGKCEHYIDMVVLGCNKCIKKFALNLTKKQIEKIAKIINESNL